MILKEIKLLAEKGKELNLGAKSVEKMKFTKIKKKRTARSGTQVSTGLRQS